MNHDVFGEIVYSKEEEAWMGTCVLPVFAEYGKHSNDYPLRVDEGDEPDAALGRMPMTIFDNTGAGPTKEQTAAFRYLRERETEACEAVMEAVLKAKGSGMNWLISWANKRRDSRWWGWLAKLVGPEQKTPRDLKQAVRCTQLEISPSAVDGYAYLAIHMVTIWGLEMEHGFSVLYHPTQGAEAGTGEAIWDAV